MKNSLSQERNILQLKELILKKNQKHLNIHNYVKVSFLEYQLSWDLLKDLFSQET